MHRISPFFESIGTAVYCVSEMTIYPEFSLTNSHSILEISSHRLNIVLRWARILIIAIRLALSWC